MALVMERRLYCNRRKTSSAVFLLLYQGIKTQRYEKRFACFLFRRKFVCHRQYESGRTVCGVIRQRIWRGYIWFKVWFGLLTERSRIFAGVDWQNVEGVVDEESRCDYRDRMVVKGP